MGQRGFFATSVSVARSGTERERAERGPLGVMSQQRAEQAKRASERAQAQLAKARESEREWFEKQAREAHLAKMKRRLSSETGEA